MEIWWREKFIERATQFFKWGKLSSSLRNWPKLNISQTCDFVVSCGVILLFSLLRHLSHKATQPTSCVWKLKSIYRMIMWRDTIVCVVLLHCLTRFVMQATADFFPHSAYTSVAWRHGRWRQCGVCVLWFRDPVVWHVGHYPMTISTLIRLAMTICVD